MKGVATLFICGVLCVLAFFMGDAYGREQAVLTDPEDVHAFVVVASSSADGTDQAQSVNLRTLTYPGKSPANFELIRFLTGPARDYQIFDEGTYLTFVRYQLAYNIDPVTIVTSRYKIVKDAPTIEAFALLKSYNYVYQVVLRYDPSMHAYTLMEIEPTQGGALIYERK